jgi:nicotinamidase-related amidase
MRSAYEKGFNTIGLTDCTATNSKEGQTAAVNGTYGMFSTPMSSADFLSKLEAFPDAPAPPAKPMEKFVKPWTRRYTSAEAKGGKEIIPSKTAGVFIEFQNEFATEGGKLYSSVSPVMQENDMLRKSAAVAEALRAAGGKVFHVPITFNKDHSDNPNKGIGILNGCYTGELFTRNTWNGNFVDAVRPQPEDVIVTGKRGLDAFPGTDLEALLRKHEIETVALAGFLTNCCVEGTMRTAYEMGFNTIGLTDCAATNSKEGQAGAVNGTYNMFSTPMSAADFIDKLKKAPAAANSDLISGK